MIKAVLFDMDGVLLDSEWIYLHSLKSLLTKLDIHAEIDELSVVVGMKMEAISNYLIAHYPIPYKAEELSALQDEAFDCEAAKSVLEPMPGLLSFLELLKCRNIKIALASSSEQGWIKQVLTSLHIEAAFDLVVSGEMVSHSKPHPEIFQKAAEMLGVETDECLVIEDSVNGINAGRAAGMRVIGYKGSKIIQDTSKADLEIHSFQELMNL